MDENEQIGILFTISSMFIHKLISVATGGAAYAK